jgi:hypothetical protein
MKRLSIELSLLVYLIAYVPYAVVTKLITSPKAGVVSRPLSGLETLPVALIISGVLLLLFVWISGWWRTATRIRSLGGFPGATRWTVLAGIGATLLLVSVPLSYTFAGVSIPFVQLLMRGDIILIAPIVDLLFGRKVRWYSWVAFALVLVGLAVNVTARDGFHIPPLLLLIIVAYTAGYFIRLYVMTKIAKNSDEQATQRYFVEEKIVSVPLSIIVLGVIAVAVPGTQGQQVHAGFVSVWSSDAFWLLVLQSVALSVIAVVSALILLDKHENTYCLPLERSASIIAGVFAAYILAIFFGLPYPTRAELFGAGLLAIAVIVLSIGPRIGQQRMLAKDMRRAPQ